MTPKRWEHIKSLRVRGRYIHISARTVHNPQDQMLPMIPWIERPGTTLVVHRMARGKN